MAYEFVRESEAKQYRSDCSYVLKETCELLKKKGISAQFSLVGSASRFSQQASFCRKTDRGCERADYQGDEMR